jgi:hypothetical protein
METRFEKIISIITKLGAIVLTTVGSFVITPPVIDPNIQVVNWHNLFVFAAGILGVVLFSKSDSIQTNNHKRTGTILIIVLIILVGLYELTYYKFSRECFGELRMIIGTESTVLPSVLRDYNESWKSKPDSIKSLLEAYNCEAQNIWPITWLLIPYWGILILYLAISGLVTFSISFVSSISLRGLNKKRI